MSSKILKAISIYVQSGYNISAIIGLTLAFYYTYAYMTIYGSSNIAVTINNDNTTNGMSIILFAIVMSEWMGVFANTLNSWSVIKYSYAVMNKDLWNAVLISNKFPVSLIKIYHIISLVCKMIFMTFPIPFSYRDCETETICRVTWVVVIVGYIEWSMFAIILFKIIGTEIIEYFRELRQKQEPIYCEIPLIKTKKMVINDSFFPIDIDDFFLKYLPIHCKSPDRSACYICNSRDYTTYDSWNTFQKSMRFWDNSWVKLPCAHNIHTVCYDAYFDSGSTIICPICCIEA